MTKNEKNITKRSSNDWKQGKTDFLKVDAAKIVESFDYTNYSEEDEIEGLQRYINLEADVYSWLKSKNLAPQQYINNLLHKQMQQP